MTSRAVSAGRVSDTYVAIFQELKCFRYVVQPKDAVGRGLVLVELKHKPDGQVRPGRRPLLPASINLQQAGSRLKPTPYLRSLGLHSVGLVSGGTQGLNEGQIRQVLSL